MAVDVALVVIALFLGGIIKATIGFGAPVVSIPILALGEGLKVIQRRRTADQSS